MVEVEVIYRDDSHAISIQIFRPRQKYSSRRAVFHKMFSEHFEAEKSESTDDLLIFLRSISRHYMHIVKFGYIARTDFD